MLSWTTDGHALAVVSAKRCGVNCDLFQVLPSVPGLYPSCFSGLTHVKLRCLGNRGIPTTACLCGPRSDRSFTLPSWTRLAPLRLERRAWYVVGRTHGEGMGSR